MPHGKTCLRQHGLPQVFADTWRGANGDGSQMRTEQLADGPQDHVRRSDGPQAAQQAKVGGGTRRKKKTTSRGTDQSSMSSNTSSGAGAMLANTAPRVRQDSRGDSSHVRLRPTTSKTMPMPRTRIPLLDFRNLPATPYAAPAASPSTTERPSSRADAVTTPQPGATPSPIMARATTTQTSNTMMPTVSSRVTATLAASVTGPCAR